jgi:DNA polymerase-3 subunit alpha
MSDIVVPDAAKKLDIVGFEHLHLHSTFSTLDGFGDVEEYCIRAPKINQKFLTISDHGMMGAVPRQIRGCDKMNDKFGKDTLSPIFACELYLNPLQPESKGPEDMKQFVASLDEEGKEQIKPSAHLLAIAYSEEGYKNLVRLTSWGWTKGFYRRPRVNYEQLLKHKEGIIFTSCCYNSEIGRAYEAGGEEPAMEMVQRYINMFGKENFYLELMLLDFGKQKPYDAFIIKASQHFGLKLILTNDCHYCNKEDSKYQRLMLMIQTKRTLKDLEKAKAENSMQDFFELQDTNLWMKSEEELNAKWLADYSDVIPYELFLEAKRNTVEICRKAKGVQLDRSLKLPQIPDADERLKEEVMKGFAQRNLPKTKEYLSRLKEEYSLITRKGFSSYFLIQKMMTDEARKACRELLGWGTGFEAVGPGRGSAVGALICYCLGITSVDPVQEGLLFSRFLSEARGGRSLVLEFKNIDPLPPKEAFQN